jgi:hypothetical protein
MQQAARPLRRPCHFWLRRVSGVQCRVSTLAMLVLFSATTALAQTAGTTQPDLGNLLTPGMTVWITDSTGQEQRARIVGVSGMRSRLALMACLGASPRTTSAASRFASPTPC